MTFFVIRIRLPKNQCDDLSKMVFCSMFTKDCDEIQIIFLSLFRPFLCLFFSNGSIADSLNKVGPEKEEFADSYKARP